MRTYRHDLTAALAALALLAAAPLGAQQVREVISSQIAVSGRDASLALEFSSGPPVEISFEGGDVVVDGETVGTFERGEALDASWRSLLSDAVQLDDGPLARALIDWSPPSDLQGSAATLGRRVDRTLEERLRRAGEESEPAAPQPQEEATTGGRTALSDLLRRTDRLEALAEALEGVSLGDVQIRVGEDVTVASGEEIDATLVVVDGDLEVRGTLNGDAVMTGGSLRIVDGGRITGDVRLADARIVRDGGEIEGEVRTVRVARERALEGLEELQNLDQLEELEQLDELEDLEEEIRDRVRDELRAEFRDRYAGPDVFAPLRNVGRGIAGLLQNLVSFLLLAGVGVLVVRFFPEHLDRVSEAARHSPARAGVVGLAGSFLLLPAYILGMIALVVSLIGIPALLAWIPLFPLAAALAAGLGYLAAARLLGGWIAEQGIQGLDFLRPSNTLHAMAAGVAALTIPFAAANVVQMAGPWLGFLEGLFLTVGWVLAAGAAFVGFGAVLMTRGGRRPRSGPGAGGDLFGDGWTPDPGPSGGPGGPTAGREPGGPANEDAWEEDETWERTWEDLERKAERRTSQEPDAGEESPPGPSDGEPLSDDSGSHGDDVGEDDGESDGEEGGRPADG